MQASTKILSRRLAVIEMAFAAVYFVVHAARRRQKGFDLVANFLGENGEVRRGGAACNPLFRAIFRPLRVHARLYPRGYKWFCDCQRHGKQEDITFAR